MKQPKAGPVHALPSFTVRVRGELGSSSFWARSFADEQAACYLSSRPAGVVEIYYSELCGACRGHGRIRSARTWKPCPACKGQPELFADTLVSTISALGA